MSKSKSFSQLKAEIRELKGVNSTLVEDLGSCVTRNQQYFRERQQYFDQLQEARYVLQRRRDTLRVGALVLGAAALLTLGAAAFLPSALDPILTFTLSFATAACICLCVRHDLKGDLAKIFPETETSPKEPSHV